MFNRKADEPVTTSHIKTYHFTRKQLDLHYRLSEEMAARGTFKETRDYANQEIIYSLTTYIWSRQVQSIELKFPASLWDHIKAALPAWLQNFFLPAAYNIHYLKADAIYPTIKDEIPGHDPILVLSVYKPDYKSFNP